MQHFRIQRDQRADEGLRIPHNNGLGDDRAGRNRVLQRCGTDVLSTRGDDDVLFPAGDEDEAIVVDRGQIAGMQPAVGIDHAAVKALAAIVSNEDVGTLDQQLVVIRKPHGDARSGTPDRTDLVLYLPVDAAGGGRFRHAIPLNEGDVVDSIEEVREVGIHRSADRTELPTVPMKKR